MKNYYEILEVNINASQEVIDKAYRVLAKKYHPDTQASDKKQWAEEKFKELNEAYEILSDSEKKKNYDLEFNKSSNKELEKLYNKNIELQNMVNNLKHSQVKAPTNISNTQTANNPVNSYNAFTSYKPKEKIVRYYTYYKSPSKLKDLLAFLITFLLIFAIGFILWKIPFTKNFLVKLYNDNAPLKSIVDIILQLLPL